MSFSTLTFFSLRNKGSDLPLLHVTNRNNPPPTVLRNMWTVPHASHVPYINRNSLGQFAIILKEEINTWDVNVVNAWKSQHRGCLLHNTLYARHTEGLRLSPPFPLHSSTLRIAAPLVAALRTTVPLDSPHSVPFKFSFKDFPDWVLNELGDCPPMKITVRTEYGLSV